MIVYCCGDVLLLLCIVVMMYCCDDVLLFYVNSLIPVPDLSLGQFEFLLSCFQRFMRTLQRAAIFYCLRWGLEPNIAFGQRSVEIDGN